MSTLNSLKGLKDCFEQIPERVAIPALNGLLGYYLFRIFNEGKATDNSLIGQPPIARILHSGGVYSESHGSSRQKRGRRTDLKDLQDTGELFNSIIVGLTTNGDAALGFRFGKNRMIANYQEEQTGKSIFKPTEEENEKLNKELETFLNAEVRRCLTK